MVSLQLRDSTGLPLRVTGFAFGPAHPGVQAPAWLTKMILSFLTISVNSTVGLTHYTLIVGHPIPGDNFLDCQIVVTISIQLSHISIQGSESGKWSG
jgi:hypothetical protein